MLRSVLALVNAIPLIPMVSTVVQGDSVVWDSSDSCRIGQSFHITCIILVLICIFRLRFILGTNGVAFSWTHMISIRDWLFSSNNFNARWIVVWATSVATLLDLSRHATPLGTGVIDVFVRHLSAVARIRWTIWSVRHLFCSLVEIDGHAVIVLALCSRMTLLVLHHFGLLELLKSHGRHEGGSSIRSSVSRHCLSWLLWVWRWINKFGINRLLNCPHRLSTCELSLIKVNIKPA